MPVTARLSRKFYEKLGEDIAQEFVDWFNMVDATYRRDLRETNELNFARFDAKLEQRVAEIDAKVGQLGTDLNAKIDQLASGLNATIEVRLAEQTARLVQEVSKLETKMEARSAAARVDLIKWTFVFWATTALAVIGLAMGDNRTGGDRTCH